MPDAVDQILKEWAVECPNLDLHVKAVTLRLQNLGAGLDKLAARTAAAEDLSVEGFYLVAALRRVGPPYEMSPKSLCSSLSMTSGGMTALLDRSAAAGLVTRRPNPADRRGIIVTLTEHGKAKALSILKRQVRLEEAFVAGLGPQKFQALADLLDELASQDSGPGE